MNLARPPAATKIIATKAQRHKEKGKKRAEWQKFKEAEKRYNALMKKEL